MESLPIDLVAANKARIAELEQLLREAENRLMVSEGDARYINNNVELAERITAALSASEARENALSAPTTEADDA